MPVNGPWGLPTDALRWELIRALSSTYFNWCQEYCLGQPVASAIRATYGSFEIQGAEKIIRLFCDRNGIRYKYVQEQARLLFRISTEGY